MSTDPKFANVPDNELRAYVEDSAQRPGESDTDWAHRVWMAERELLAKYPEAVKDTPVEPNAAVETAVEAVQGEPESYPQ